MPQANLEQNIHLGGTASSLKLHLRKSRIKAAKAMDLKVAVDIIRSSKVLYY
jgi:glutathione synthase/RimK-type ligase-like ATP-grasp enzyme